MNAGLLLTAALLTLPLGPVGDAVGPASMAPDASPVSMPGGQGQRPQARMRFQGMDRNNDGVITRDEWRGSARSFDVHDWNGDGQLSGQEVRVGAWQDTSLEQADHDPSSRERYVSWTDAGFASLDHNRDRRITPNEWHYDRETFLRADRNGDSALDREEFLGADMDDDRGDKFDDLDLNGDNRVDRNEWHASDDAFRWLDRNRDGVLSRVEVTGDDRVASVGDQFASLDYDGNGTISRNEWHWSLGSFSQRDLNRDGVLSRREFAMRTGSASSSTGPVPMVRVDPKLRWTDTGIDVRAGDVLTISARGTIQMSTDPNDVATPAGSRTGRSAPASPINAIAGVLIARIDESAPIVVGDQRSVTASREGRLYLGVNDDHLPDNTGEFQVTIGFQNRTE